MEHLTKNSMINIGTKKILIEFTGTMALTYAACWSVIYSDIKMLSLVGYGLSSASILGSLMFLFIPITGGQFNPSITLALFLIRRLDLPTTIWYLIAQYAGAVCGAALIFLEITETLYSTISQKSILGMPMPGNPQYDISPFWGEVIGSFVLMWIYTALVSEAKVRQSEMIGASAYAITYFLMLVTVGEISGGSFNPARVFGPSVIVIQIGFLQMCQFVGPFVGSIAAAFLYRLMYVDPVDDNSFAKIHKDFALITKNEDIQRTSDPNFGNNHNSL